MTSPLVLLDLDGTLMDSAPGITSSAAHAYRTLGLDVPDAATLRTFVGPPITDSFPAHGVPPERVGEAVTAYRSVYADGGMYDATVFAGIPEALAALREAGCTLAVATSKPEVYAQPVCAKFGLGDLVDAVFGAPLDESTSTKADVIERALATLDLPRPGTPGAGPVLMVGDREHDVHGAAVHAVGCLGVSWGYAVDGELERAGALAVVEDVADLAATVLELLGR
ncbi:phosphoglycolate phosphatase [Isoptericola jiangsuensis]|uniref:Phosphoglycolate phosphatase n=1 Tax=Isoptericola jiangsuensis TaxID=548579 RepID=A0A2A9ETS0_9MICO|nr:HAD hydrolase-like protein [Isoptericola jiangsuensis]PFG41966.1 phosphoglycolate phosphatase [Isoptericola jiangsuensis]